MNLCSRLDAAMKAASDAAAQLIDAFIPAIERVAEQARRILRDMPTLIQTMPEDKFQAMLAEAETAEVRAILVRMRYGGNHDEDIHSR